MDEINNKEFFKQSKIAYMKRFLEGKGWPTDTKWGNVEIKYLNCNIIITSNEYPHE
jgi:hypothetical protein